MYNLKEQFIELRQSKKALICFSQKHHHQINYSQPKIIHTFLIRGHMLDSNKFNHFYLIFNQTHKLPNIKCLYIFIIII